MQTTQNAEITRRVWDKIDALPQRAMILDSDARAWVDAVVGSYGDLAIWHAARAGGFGGSQIGALVKNFMGERADHEASAHDIVAGALLRKLPDEPNGHMRRGIAMEPQHRRWFHEKYGSVRDEEGFLTLSKSVGPRPWMRYSPDELATMATSSLNGRVLIDFKAPSEVAHESSVPFQYTCQLHMGRMVLQHNGLDVDGLMLSQFDWKGWALKDDVVPYIAELDDLIVKAGDHYWDYVMRGELPPYVHKPRLENEAELREQLGDVSMRLASLKALKTLIEGHIEGFEEEVKPQLAKHRLGRSKVVLEGISYSASSSFDKQEVLEKLPTEVFEALPLSGNSTKAYDDKAMLARLKELGEDVKKFAKPTAVDPDALYDALLAHGIDADALVSERLTGRVDKKLAADVKSWFEREFSGLVPKSKDLEGGGADGAPSSETDGREGQEVSPYVPRPVTA